MIYHYVNKIHILIEKRELQQSIQIIHYFMHNVLFFVYKFIF